MYIFTAVIEILIIIFIKMKVYDYLMRTLFVGIMGLAITACNDDEDDNGGSGSEPGQTPTVETFVATDVTTTAAVVGGSVTDDGGVEVTARGIVWDEQENPTVDLPTKTVEGGGKGQFSSELTELKANTKYYYRAYATNVVGTSYGEELTFTTGMESTMSVSVGNLTIDMILVEGGTFQMGATDEQKPFADKWNQTYEYPVHNVTLDSYYIGKYEVSQALWIAVMGNNPSAMIKDNACPVDYVTYTQCIEFCEKLSEMTGLEFTLPTEAQWEYAARGGNKSSGFVYSGSNDATEVGWVAENMVEIGQHPCGEKLPNELGIYDMTGNVNEWCLDKYELYSAEDQVNPTGAGEDADPIYVVRGGSYLTEGEKYCRNSKRMNYPYNYQQMELGLRLALKNK